ncbi:GNAT family N-acetyltransferase [Fulvivirgaceae bacterium BMA10]|uniref:GNAT family N-acetyltransferase n=1 Tax=Splendidivirga corallicola TaxID=3051826 RepID=A0ABT8KXQ5_9BACT|nr:GNAT family N-acetyltransferase [Fulvivirgaceae bacterium BMA10]
MKFGIRKHNPGDIGWIIGKHGEIYTNEFNFDPGFEIHIANKFIDFFKDPFNTVWIAEVNGERAGSIAVSKKSDKKAFVNFVLVLNKHRGHKIAQKLFEVVIRHCRDHQFELLELETYNCLESARRLYDKIGFKITEVNKDMELFGLTIDQEFWEMSL